MFGFGRKRGDAQAPPGTAPKGRRKTAEPEIAPELDEQIHAIPERFYVQQQSHSRGFPLVLIGGVIVLGALGVSGYFFYQAWQQRQSPPPAVNAAPSPSTNTAPANGNTPSNRPAVNAAPPVATTSPNLNANLNASTTPPVVTTSPNLNANTNTNPEPAPLPSAPDVDGDALTLAEEVLYGTDPNNSDSDGDSYGDGSELLNGFDPSRPKLTVTETGLFSTYSHPDYSWLYPSAWQVTEQAQDQVYFRSVGGEFVEVLEVENTSGQDLLSWYREQFPHRDPRVDQVTIGELSGYHDQASESYYLARPNDANRIYVLSYRTGDLRQANYRTTFAAMVKTFHLIQR